MEITDKVSSLALETGDKVSRAAEALGDKGDQLKNAEQRFIKECCSYISEKPLTSVAIATAAGFLLSRVLSGR